MQEQEVARYWDANADTWARHVRAGYDTYRELFNNPAFVAFVGDLAGLEVLDAGCGEGHNTRLFARLGARMTGVDLSPRMIALAREEEARQPLGIRYTVASMADLAPFTDASFDAVISTMALMDCAAYDEVMRACYRVLRPGGLLAFNLLHPCFTYDEIFGWEQDAQGEIIGIRLGDYFKRQVYTQSWAFGAAPEAERGTPFTIMYFDRTLADLLNPLCAAGFRLERVEEPQPSEEACRVKPGLRKHRLIPHTLCLRARKG